MKNKILLLLVSSLALFACTSTYRSGQTPDDVYFSPVRLVAEDDTNEEKEDSLQNYEDNQIRMTIRDRRWRDLDNRYDYNYSYNPYLYGYTYPYYYNPYYYPYPVHNGTFTIKNNPVRSTNLSSYNSTPTTIRDPKTGVTRSAVPSRSYNQRNFGSGRREVLGSSGDNSGSGNTRTYTPSSGSTRSSGTTVTRPARGN